MRFRIKSGQSARRFVFDRRPPQSPRSRPRPAPLTSTTPTGGTTAPPAAARTCGRTDKHLLLPLPGALHSRAEGVLFSIFVFLRRCDLKYSPL